MNTNLFTIIAGIILIFVIFVMMVTIMTRYTKVGPNQMLIVSGRKVRLPDGSTAGFRIVRGGGTFVLPVIEKVDVLSLEVLAVELPRTRARTADGRGVQMDCTAQVKINSNDASIVPATEFFLGKSPAEIKNIVRPTIEKHVAETVNATSAEYIVQNPASCAAAIQSAAAEDLARMGMSVISVTVRNASTV